MGMAWKLKQDGERVFVSVDDLGDAERETFDRAKRIADSQNDADYVQRAGKWWKVEAPPEDAEEQGYWLREATKF